MRPLPLVLCLLLLTIISCTSTKKITYFTNLGETGNYRATIDKGEEPKIQPDDLLSITVSSLNPESNILFNNGILPTAGSGSQVAVPTHASDGYLVDKNGNINFPVIGSIALGGLTKAEANEKLTSAIKNFIKNPIINIRFLNFKITVLGEVTRPSSYNIVTEKVNVLEALSMAGDMTVYGRRDNVLIIREKDGVRSTTRIDLADKNVLGSPAFYLQQNDIVYVEPSGGRAVQASTQSFYLPIVLTAVSVLSILVSTLKR